MRKVVFALAAFCVVASLQGVSAEEAYPRRAIKLIVPFAAGGNTDVVGRLTASYMQKALNANVVVENRAGAGGINGTDAVAKAAPDGYTLCICGIGPITVSPATEKLPYDPLKDLAPISLINTNPLVLVVNPQVKASSAAELAALSKSVPDGLSYGTVGAGGLMQFAAEIFRVKTGSKFTSVPYRGGALATAAVVTGEVQLAFSNMSDAMGQLAAGTVRPLAITTAKRSPHMPDIPTLIELGLVDYPVESWNALFAPAGTPPEVIARLNQAVVEVVAMPEVRERMKELGGQARGSTPEALAKHLKDDINKWKMVVEQAGIERQ